MNTFSPALLHLNASAGEQIRSALLPTETLNPALASILDLLNLPRIMKKLIAYYYRSSDPLYAGLLDVMHPKSIFEERELIVKRDAYREEWHEKWTEEGLDFVLSVACPFPALENGTAEKASLMSAGYTLLFNLVSIVQPINPSFPFHPMHLSAVRCRLSVVDLATAR